MTMIAVTNVKIYLPEGETKNLFAYATIELAETLVIHDVQVYRSPRGLAVAMPERTRDRKCRECHCRISQLDRWCGRCGVSQPIVPKDEIRYRDIVHPICREQRQEIDTAVLAAFAARQAKTEVEATPQVAG